LIVPVRITFRYSLLLIRRNICVDQIRYLKILLRSDVSRFHIIDINIDEAIMYFWICISQISALNLYFSRTFNGYLIVFSIFRYSSNLSILSLRFILYE